MITKKTKKFNIKKETKKKSHKLHKSGGGLFSSNKKQKYLKDIRNKAIMEIAKIKKNIILNNITYVNTHINNAILNLNKLNNVKTDKVNSQIKPILYIRKVYNNNEKQLNAIHSKYIKQLNHKNIIDSNDITFINDNINKTQYKTVNELKDNMTSIINYIINNYKTSINFDSINKLTNYSSSSVGTYTNPYITQHSPYQQRSSFIMQ